MGKVTNDERREVARRLREVQSYVIPGTKTEAHPIAGRIIGVACGYDLPDFQGLLGLLADLIEPDTTTDTTTDTTKSKTTRLSSSLCDLGVSSGSPEATPKYSEVTPKQGCPYWDGECMCRVTRRVVDVDALLELADEMQGYADGAVSRYGSPYVNAGSLWSYADRIREACGVSSDGR